MPIAYFIVNLLAGASATFAFAPFGWYPLVFIVGIATLYTWTQLTPRIAFYCGYIFGFAYALGSTYWIYYSLHDYGAAHPLFAGFMVLLLSAILAIYYALLAFLISHSVRYFSHKAVYFLICPSLWVWFEWIRSFSSVGYPWNLLGQALIDSPLYGIFPVVGIYGTSFLVIFCSACGAYILTCNTFKQRVLPLLSIILLIMGTLFLKNIQWTLPDEEPVSFALIQGNIDQSIKFDRAYTNHVIDTYRLTTLDHLDKDLIIWPETALPMYADTAYKHIFNRLLPRLKDSNSHLLTGIFYRDQGMNYNSILNVNDGTVYHKKQLVPFGEYIPLRNWFSIFENLINIPMSNLHSSNNRPLLSVGQNDVGVSICYESAFSEVIADALPEASYLINVSNDSWFGMSSAPFQLLQMARVRSAEVARSTLRITSTGISAVIDWRGQISQQSDIFKQQVLTGMVQPRSGATPYIQYRNKPVLVITLILIILALFMRRHKVNQ